MKLSRKPPLPLNMRLIVGFILVFVLSLVANSGLGFAQSDIVDCSACHVAALRTFDADPVGSSACGTCHQALLPGTCDIGTIASPFGYFKSPYPTMDAHALHANHSGVNDRAGQPECARCHGQVDCNACHQQVPHVNHGMAFPGFTPLTVVNGFTQYQVSPTCANPQCHAVVQNSPMTRSFCTKIDTATFFPQSMPSGNNPRSVAENRLLKRLYVANYNDNTVSVIDNDASSPYYKQLLTNIQVGIGPCSVTVAETAGKIYVANASSFNISVIDCFANTVVNTITLGGSPRDGAIDRSTGRLYVPLYDKDAIVVLDTASGGQVVGMIPLIGGAIRPQAIEVDQSTGNIFVACYNNNTSTGIIQVIDRVTGTVTATVSIPGLITDIASDDPTGCLFIGGSAGLNVLNTRMGMSVNPVPLGGGPTMKLTLALDITTRRVYAAANALNGSSTLHIIDADTLSVLQSLPSGMYSQNAFKGSDQFIYLVGGSSTLVPEPKPQCMSCHTSIQVATHSTVHEPNPYLVGSTCQPCHENDVSYEHTQRAVACDTCHLGTGPLYGVTALRVIQQYKVSPKTYADKAGCQDCHPTVQGTKGVPASLVNQNHITLHSNVPDLTGTVCVMCHAGNLTNEHAARTNPITGRPYDCQTCHGPQAPQPAKDAIARFTVTGVKSGCADCHTGINPDYSAYSGHVALHESAEMTATCFLSGCHTSSNLANEHQAKGLSCLSCHDYKGTRLDLIRVKLAIDTKNTNCSGCHSLHNINAIHTASNIGTTYRGYECVKCHNSAIIAEHTDKPSSSTYQIQCTTCHPTPRTSFTVWDKSCSQGGCHTAATGNGSVHTLDTQKHATSSTECVECHIADVSAIHLNTTAVNGTMSCGISNLFGSCHVSPDALPTTNRCQDCHIDKTTSNHGYNTAQHTASSSLTGCFASNCHASELKTEHEKYISRLGFSTSCNICHTILPGRNMTWAKQVKPWDKTCDACHGQSPHHLREPYGACGECHEHTASEIHGEDDHKATPCSTCHGPNAPGCVACHEEHTVSGIHGEHKGEVTCNTCHTSGAPLPPQPSPVIVTANIATWITGIYSPSSRDSCGSYHDITAALKDGILVNGYDVVKATGSSKVITSKLTKDSRACSKVIMKVNVSSIQTTPATVRIYCYYGDGVSVGSYMDMPIISTGWQQWDITLLAQKMAGYGWMKFRIASENITFGVSEVEFAVTPTTSSQFCYSHD